MERVDYQSIVIQDLINLEKKDELNLNPWYQRRSVWTSNQKSYLINTLLEKKPIPAIYIRHSLDLEKEKSIKEIVDGQQRTRAILGFYRNEFTSFHPELNKRVKFENLNANQKQAFLLTAIPIGYLQGAMDEDVIDIFARINSVSKSLNSQEKRNAEFSGIFKQLCVKESVKRLEFWRSYKIFSSNDIARMNEVQFISDFIINLIEGITNLSSAKLNKYYKKYDDEFEDAEVISTRLNKIFDTLVNLSPESIMDTVFKRAPLFFSVMLVIDSLEKPSLKKIENGLFEIDSIFNSDIPVSEREKEDIAFYNAVSATTQGKEQRSVRDTYIRKFIS